MNVNKWTNNNTMLFGPMHKIRWMLCRDEFIIWIVYSIIRWASVHMHLLFIYYHMWLQQLKIKKKMTLKKGDVSYIQISNIVIYWG